MIRYLFGLVPLERCHRVQLRRLMTAVKSGIRKLLRPLTSFIQSAFWHFPID